MVWYTLSTVGRTTAFPAEGPRSLVHLLRHAHRWHAWQGIVAARRGSWCTVPTGLLAASPALCHARGRGEELRNGPERPVRGCGIGLERTNEGSFCRCSGTCALGFAPEQCGMRRTASGETPGGVRLGGELWRELGAGPLADEILPQLVEAVAKALHLSYLAVEMMYAGQRITVASYGHPSSKLAAFPFKRGDEAVAWMVFGRTFRRPLRRRDCRALKDLVAPVGEVTQTLRQAVELQRQAVELHRLREQLTAAREEERRQLRRDLHDGVAPSVAATALHLETAEELIKTDPSAAKDLIGRVRQGTKDLVDEIRRLAGCLGHSPVDQVGLVCAIRERAWCLADAAAAPAPTASPAPVPTASPALAPTASRALASSSLPTEPASFAATASPGPITKPSDPASFAQSGDSAGPASPASSRDGIRERVTVEAAGDVDSLPAATEAAAFHLVSDVLALVYGAGSPVSCCIRLRRGPAALEAEVSVEGEADAGGSLAPVLSSLGRGAAMLGADLNVDLSAPGCTAVRIQLPLPSA